MHVSCTYPCHQGGRNRRCSKGRSRKGSCWGPARTRPCSGCTGGTRGCIGPRKTDELYRVRMCSNAAINSRKARKAKVTRLAFRMHSCANSKTQKCRTQNTLRTSKRTSKGRNFGTACIVAAAAKICLFTYSARQRTGSRGCTCRPRR